MAKRRYQAFPRKRGSCITLIGMPGCGKSTLGRVTAKRMRRAFIDTDHVLCAREAVSGTGELSARCDFETFIRLEEAAVLSVKAEHSIIATGGSVVYSRKAMRHLQRLGPVFYIRVPVETLEARVRSVSERGVILQEGQTFRDLFNVRHRLYRRYADMEFVPNELDVRTSAKLLAALIEYTESEYSRLYEQEKNRCD